ncbi:MAG: hypothetical protein HY275_18365 [Gemmatimonadetes bacterium]|nr:hypothetical protein [Gemmatimonadota bacterium]
MALSPQTPPPRALQSKPRRVHLVLRDGAEVEGGIFLNDGQSLALYLGSRKGGWVNLVNAQWILPVEEMVNHAVIQADHVLYAYGPDGDVPVHSVTGQIAVRHVEVTLTTDARIRGQLNIADRQRLSDFLHTVGKFIPIVAVHRADNDQLVGDIALNHSAVRVLRDTAPAGRQTSALDGRSLTPALGATAVDREGRMTPASSRGVEPAAGGAPTRRATPSMPLGGVSAEEAARRVTPPPQPARMDAEPGVRSEQIAVGDSHYTLELPGPPTERRSGSRTAVRARITLNLEGDNPVEVSQEPIDEPEPFSPAVAARNDRIARHWLALVAQRFGLAPADPRKLDDAFTTEQLWDQIARANDITGDEFAVHVASTFRVPVARLDRIEAAAVKLLDEKVARKFGMIPVRADEKSLTVACSDPTDLEMEQALRFATRHAVQFELAPPRAIRGALDWWYRGELRPSTSVQAVRS